MSDWNLTLIIDVSKKPSDVNEVKSAILMSKVI